MTKQEWLQICRLNQEWYFRQAVLDGKPLTEDDEKWIKEHMPHDCIFDDGRIEFFQQNFKPEINEEKLDELVHNHINEWGDTLPKTIMAWADGFKVGYRNAKKRITK